jgi:hypothetical protein
LKKTLPVPKQELEEQWTLLGDPSPIKAYGAMRRLLASPEVTLPFVKERLRPEPDQTKKISVFIADLDSDDAEQRQRAEAGLLELGEAGAMQVQKAIRAGVPLEVDRRLKRVLEKLKDEGPGHRTRRMIWAIDLLEQLGTPEARALLEDLGKGSTSSWVTREANASLDRLRNAAKPQAAPWAAAITFLLLFSIPVATLVFACRIHRRS